MANKLAVGWWNTPLPSDLVQRIIFTSWTQVEGRCDKVIEPKVKRRVYRRKKVVHSGFGIHSGLKERLGERKWLTYL